MAGGGGVFHGVARHDDSEYRGADHRGGARRGSAEHEVGAGKLHFEPRGVHSDQRLDGGPVRNAPGVCVRHRHLHARVVSLRHIERHPCAGRVPHPAGLRRSDDGAGGPAHHGADVRQIRTHPRHELRRHPRSDWSDARPIAGGLIVGYLHWRLIFFVNIPIGLLGLYMVYRHLPDYREEHTNPLDIAGLILFGSGVALLSYVLEVFGEHTLSAREILGLLAISIVLLAGYGFHATRRPHFPCCV